MNLSSNFQGYSYSKYICLLIFIWWLQLICTLPLQCYVILYLSVFLPLPMRFTLSCCYLTCFNSIWRTPLMISLMASLVVTNSLCLCLRKALFPSFYRTLLRGTLFLICNCFRSVPSDISSSPLLVWKVSVEKATNIVLRGFLCMWLITFLFLSKFSLTSDSLIEMFLGVTVFMFNLFGVRWASCVYISISLPRFEIFSTIISLKKLSAPSSILLLWSS